MCIVTNMSCLTCIVILQYHLILASSNRRCLCILYVELSLCEKGSSMDEHELLSEYRVADIFCVTSKTVSKWLSAPGAHGLVTFHGKRGQIFITATSAQATFTACVRNASPTFIVERWSCLVAYADKLLTPKDASALLGSSH